MGLKVFFKQKSRLKQEKIIKKERDERKQRIINMKQDAQLSRQEQLDVYRKNLNILGHLVPEKMLKMYYEIGTSFKDVNSTNNILAFLFILIASSITFFGIILHLAFSWIIGITLVVIASISLLFHYNLKNKYDDVQASKQKKFNIFTQIIIPHLQPLIEGADISTILETIRNQLYDDYSRNMVDRLTFEIFRHPGSPKPFKRFAKDMSGTDIADQFMDNIYQLSMGSSETSGVQYLVDLSQKDLVDASQSIVDKDLSVMEIIKPFLLYLFFAVVLIYLASSMIALLGQVANQI
ncbi:hypothetical protein DY052_05920 [Apilactobacillus timberlakei]|uniref:hypothetical protein n=1 Tax=Apilactobacillus timberlakei TaxID=2008380 RepID=UPI00112E3102|nr:hypothetical protein [Apilactobacillus timberlakei]TPR14960.1 hypothetical protein DY052_05920 [Apilactobacillus timberlakei]